MATTHNVPLIESNVHQGYHGCRYVMCRPQDLLYTEDLDGKTFDIVICLNFLQELDGLVDKIKVVMAMMHATSVLQVGEVIHTDKQHNFEYLIENAGLKIIHVMDITKNVLKALQKLKEKHSNFDF